MVGDTYDLNQQGQIKYPKPISAIGQQPAPLNPPSPVDALQTGVPNQMAGAQAITGMWRQHFGPLPKYTPTTLNPQQERQYQAWVNSRNSWFSDKPEQKAIALAGGGDYDYRGAWLGNVRPQRNGHWVSTLNGRPLKNPETHPTWWKEEFLSKYGPQAEKAKFNIDAPGMTREKAWQFITNQGVR